MKSLDREIADLLRAVVQPADADGGETALPDLAAKIIRWQEVIEGARQHGVVPMLYSRLVEVKKALPPGALDLVRNEFERNAFHCMANTAELLDVLKAFEEASIPAIPFKGVVLAASAYHDVTARTAGDLDVLIYHRDLPRATQILQHRGYELTTKVLEDGSPELEDYFEYHFERAEDGMVLELRWRLELTQPRYRHDLGLDWVWPRRRTARLAGADVPNLDAVSALLILCMHGTKHVWSRLVWICDVGKLLESEPDLDWHLAQREAKRVGLWRSLALGVLLARRITGVEVPAEALRGFEADRGARKLAEWLGSHVFEAPGTLPDQWMPYGVQILGFRDRARIVLSPTFLRPNAQDRAVVKLPKALEPLYYLIRPFRILLDRRAR